MQADGPMGPFGYESAAVVSRGFGPLVISVVVCAYMGKG